MTGEKVLIVSQESTVVVKCNVEDNNTRPTKRQKQDNGTDVEKLCEKCQISKPRSKYNKKQWAKIYGGWTCQECSNQQGSVERKKLKQRQHDQKMADQQSKKEGKFFDERTCFQCLIPKPKEAYAGKQWKQLYRQCKQCVVSNGLMKVRLEEKEPATSGFKFCSGCKETKLHSEFTGDQWRHPVDAERLCKTCWKEEGEAKREHRELSEQQKRINPDLKRCYACHEFLLLDKYFSGKQGKKLYGFCTSCVEFLREDRQKDNKKARESSTRACSICGKQKTIVEFGRGQWKRIDPRCSPCATALVQKMDQHRQLEKSYYTNEENEDLDNIAAKKMRRCFHCGEFKEQSFYSGRQWTKTYAACLICFRETQKREESGIDVKNE
mmetsp:Transcript_37235/g.42511  ORF Transcript_37235/g.42511 Transcript_37235/m.42511 type:complete len:381 (-) Transcript_37235:182-1324(-)